MSRIPSELRRNSLTQKLSTVERGAWAACLRQNKRSEQQNWRLTCKTCTIRSPAPNVANNGPPGNPRLSLTLFSSRKMASIRVRFRAGMLVATTAGSESNGPRAKRTKPNHHTSALASLGKHALSRFMKHVVGPIAQFFLLKPCWVARTAGQCESGFLPHVRNVKMCQASLDTAS